MTESGKPNILYYICDNLGRLKARKNGLSGHISLEAAYRTIHDYYKLEINQGRTPLMLSVTPFDPQDVRQLFKNADRGQQKEFDDLEI